MGIWLSCGHREDDFDKHHSIMLKEWDITEEGWTKAVSYQTVCYHCFKEYEKEGNLIYSDKEATEWLLNKGKT